MIRSEFKDATGELLCQRLRERCTILQDGESCWRVFDVDLPTEAHGLVIARFHDATLSVGFSEGLTGTFQLPWPVPVALVLASGRQEPSDDTAGNLFFRNERRLLTYLAEMFLESGAWRGIPYLVIPLGAVGDFQFVYGLHLGRGNGDDRYGAFLVRLPLVKMRVESVPEGIEVFGGATLDKRIAAAFDQIDRENPEIQTPAWLKFMKVTKDHGEDTDL